MKTLPPMRLEQILIGPPASWRMISPLLSRISFWYRLVRFRSPPAARSGDRLAGVLGEFADDPECLRFAFVSQIAVDDDGIRALARKFWISGR
jgi:hypothetical protein